MFTVQVPFFFKEAVDALTPTHGTLAVVPIALLLACKYFLSFSLNYINNLI